MKLKSFFGGSVVEALGLAREELGPEAILVNSRKSPPEARHLGSYEVVAARMADQPPAGDRPPEGARLAGEPAPVHAAPRETTDGQLCWEVAELKRQVERMHRAFWQSGLSRSLGMAAGCRTEVLPVLLEADVDPVLALEVAACVEARLAGDPLLVSAGATNAFGTDRTPLRRTLMLELSARISVDSSLGRPGEQPRIVALVGPPGVGKTTTLAKLAAAEALKCRRPVQLLSMDTYRIAPLEPLRTYASILGMGLQPAPTALALKQAIQEHLQKDLILIDTPGFGPRDMDAAAEVAAVLTSQPAIDVHLVLPATARSADLTRTVDRFEVFRPSKLLFTRLDEAVALGPAFNEAARTAKAISFLATGQSVPEDLEAATAERLAGLILEQAGGRAVPAASEATSVFA